MGEIQSKLSTGQTAQSGTKLWVMSGEERDAKGVKMKEIKITDTKTNGGTEVMCDSCLTRCIESGTVVGMCVDCELYLCGTCTKQHTRHRLMNAERKSDIQNNLFTRLVQESSIRRRAKIKTEQVSVCDEITAVHSLDDMDEFDVNGLCGMDNNMLVVCDFHNKCVKILNLRSRAIERYMVFDEYPWDVALVDIKLGHIDPDSESKKTPNMTILHHDAPSKDCAIAVTFPHKRQITYIDCNTNPAITTKTIQLDTHPHKLVFNDGNLFILCNKTYHNSPWYVYVMSADGALLRRLKSNVLYGTPPAMCVLPGRVYITDPFDDRVHCIDQGRSHG